MTSTSSFKSVNGTVGVVVDPCHPAYAEVANFLGDFDPQNERHSVLTPEGIETLCNSQLYFMEIDRDVEGVRQRLKAGKEDMIKIRTIFSNENSSAKDRTWACDRLTEILNGQARSCT